MLSLAVACEVTRRYHRDKDRSGMPPIPRCHYCKKPRTGTTKDHIVPKAMGGPNSGWNYAHACPDCNRAKADSWPTCACGQCRRARRLFRELKRQGKIVDKKVKESATLIS